MNLLANQRFRSDLIFLVALGAVCVMLLWPGLSAGHVPAFRDAYHFYYPQAVWLDQCATDGEWFPQWNRDEGLGASVAGQVSTALYYPLRVVWLLPWLSVGQRMAWFILLHVLVAGLGIRWAALELRRVTPLAASLAGFAYALSCPVYFQHNNLIYLTSASWIGFALVGIFRRLQNQERGWSGLVYFALSTSMMFLGGDPHTAVNTFIIALLAIAGSGVTNRSWLPSVQQLGWLSLAGTILVCVTFCQWVPAVRWSRHSNRQLSNWSLLNDRDNPAAQTIVSVGLPATPLHADLVDHIAAVNLAAPQLFEFSVPPWHFGTMLWPTLGGHFLQQNSRWFSALPAEGRVWLPSLYFGSLHCLVVMLGMVLSRRRRWLLAMGLFAMLAASGNFSPLWLLREILGLVGDASWLEGTSDGSFSVYGILAQIIPGYSAFRFPAKWTPWIAAALALYSASQIHLLSRIAKYRRLLVIIGCYAVGSAGIMLTGASLWLQETPAWWERTMPVDAWLGQAGSAAAGQALVLAGLIPLVTLASVWLLSCQRRSLILLTAVTLFELSFCASRWTTFTDAPPALALAHPSEPTLAHAPLLWGNYLRAHWSRHTRSATTDLDRQTDLQNKFQLGKLALISGVRNLAASQTIEPALIERLRYWLAANDNLQTEQSQLDYRLAQLGVNYRLAERPDSPVDLEWLPIPNPAPQCQWIPLDPESEFVDATVEWQWLSRSTLGIKLESPAEGRLVIRQFNDGGWQLEHRGTPAQALQILDLPSRLFIEVAVPAGVSEFTVTRKWLW